MAKTFSLSIWWIKRDLRLADNRALTKALRMSEQVLPMFLFEPSITQAPDYSDFHKYACTVALQELRAEVVKRGGDVLIREAEFERALEEIQKKVEVAAVFSHEETGVSFTFQRDKRVARALRERNISWLEFPTNGVFRGLRDRSKRSALWNERMREPSLATPHSIPLGESLREMCTSAPRFTTSIPPNSLERVSENAAATRLHSFLRTRGQSYSGSISSPNTAFVSGSRLSAQLAWGTISLRQVQEATAERNEELRESKTTEAKQWRKSLRAFSSRLHWHDHFVQRLESEPEMEFRCLNSVFEALPYRADTEKLRRWLHGQTGVPMVDACMRCLQSTGFLNFRMRAMIVSYACHVLHLSWKDIMHPLARLFLDYEPGIHVSQLQMQAGVVGINTLRVYNPDKQMADQDPDLRFVRQWVVELQKFAKPEIYNYLESSLPAYVSPMVNYTEASKVMKTAVYRLKRSTEGREESKKVLEKHGSRKHRQKKRKTSKDNRQLQLF